MDPTKPTDDVQAADSKDTRPSFVPNGFVRTAPVLTEAELDFIQEEHMRLRNEWIAAGSNETASQKACRERMDYVQFYGMTK